MTLNINSTEALNSTQTPIDVSYQLVYAIMKELQYRYPHLFEKYCPIRDRILSMWEGGPEGFCGGHEIFKAYIDGP